MMHGSKIFAKLDIHEAYTQIEVEEESRKIANFNTDDEIYCHKRFVYRINNAFEIFQRVLKQYIDKIESVKFIIDDIILHAQNEVKLLQILERSFSETKSLGLKLNKDKCIFITDKLKFFVMEILSGGISPNKNKIKVIKMHYH